MAWNFHLFSNLVSICCETFRNVSNSDLVIFGSVLLKLFQLIHYIIYMFQCSKPKIYGLEFSPFLKPCINLLRNVSNSDLSFLGLFQFVSVDLLYNLYVLMFCNKNMWPGIFSFSLTLFLFVAKPFKVWSFLGLFQIVSADSLYNLYVSMF